MVFFVFRKGWCGMLTIVKALNNNIILATADNKKEVVAFGTGIGFNKKKDDLVSENEVTKLFYSDQYSSIENQLIDIPPKILAVTEKIISLSESALNKKLSSTLLFSLADHLNFSLNNQQFENDNPIKWEIPYLYYQEYEVGKQALDTIEIELGVRLSNDEASFIALHLVNAQIDSTNMSDTIQVTQLIKEIVKIVQTKFELTLDKTTISYSRFVTHLRYFIVRQERSQPLSKMDSSLKAMIQQQYKTSYECAISIQKALKTLVGWQIAEDEIVYLVIHIQRIITESKIK